MNAAPKTILDAAQTVLNTADPDGKSQAALNALSALESGLSLGDYSTALADTPARPQKPALVPPGDVPRRRLGAEGGRIALLHAIAHIEFNAIDLAFDMAIRFKSAVEEFGLDPLPFVKDWFTVGADEARHFQMIKARLSDFGASYGDLPAHNGLWEAALNTKGSVLARLVVAPLILEARGLDVTPEMIKKLRGIGDSESVGVLEVIYRDEIGHVACGNRWFHRICTALGKDPAATFQELKEKHFSGGLKPPFNHDARHKAGLDREFYAPE